MKPFLIGVAGGTGSGKSTVADRLIAAVGHQRVAVVALDAYYNDHGHLQWPDRVRVNYDHPDAFDWPLLQAHLAMLRSGQPAEVPVYDFASHTRSGTTVTVRPGPIIVVEGILVLYEATIRDQLDLKVFVDADADVRFIRRLRRDVSERGRTPDSIIDQYLGTVRPSHLQFIEPSKRYADVIIPHGGHNDAALDCVFEKDHVGRCDSDNAPLNCRQRFEFGTGVSRRDDAALCRINARAAGVARRDC